MAQARTNGKADVADVTAQIDTIKQDIAALTALMTDLAQTKTDEAKEHAAGKAAAFKASATETMNQAQIKAKDAGARMRTDAEAAYYKAEDTVRQQPALAVGIAAGIGFLVGSMMSRRS